MITFGDGKQDLAKYVGTGISDPEDSRVASAVNEASERLLQLDEGEYSMQLIQLCSYRGAVTLPREFEKMIKCRNNGVMAYPMSKWYEFLEFGPGLLEDSTNLIDPIDRGTSPLQYDVPLGSAWQILVFSDEEEDASIDIMGKDAYGREIMSSSRMGETVPIKYERDIVYSSNSFSEITGLKKPVTNGYVYLSAWNPANYTRYHLVALHPHITIPEFRRYQIFETHCKEADRPDPDDFVSQRIDALCRRRHVQMYKDNELLPVPVMGAMKMILRAMHFEDIDDVKKSLEFEVKATALLERKEAIKEHKGIQIDANEAWGMGGVENLQ